jgi:primosomal protein N' (replication factor Y)
LNTYFLGAKIARMDIDTTRGKHAHDEMIQRFESGAIDILVGTQMVVKGLDFDRVDLVGILDADGLLHFADFRASERAFQLMEQVSGRAGRKEANGEVIVQTSDPTHSILQQVAAHDYLQFYQAELKKRISFGYPPGHRMIRILFRHKNPSLVDRAADEWAAALSPAWKKMLIGPAEPLIARIRNQYRIEAWLRIPRNAGITAAKKQIRIALERVEKNKNLSRVEVILDVDPAG